MLLSFDIRATRPEKVILLVLVIWTSMVLLVPYTIPSGSVDDLSGRVGVIDNSAQLEEMNPFARAIYTMGDVYCHQAADRSFFLNDNQMPFCSRDVGLFLGMLGGMLAVVLLRLTLPLWMAIALIMPMAFDSSLQLLTAYESSNGLRVITGILAGVGISLILSLLIGRMIPSSDLERKNKGE